MSLLFKEFSVSIYSPALLQNIIYVVYISDNIFFVLRGTVVQLSVSVLLLLKSAFSFQSFSFLRVPVVCQLCASHLSSHQMSLYELLYCAGLFLVPKGFGLEHFILTVACIAICARKQSYLNFQLYFKCLEPVGYSWHCRDGKSKLWKKYGLVFACVALNSQLLSFNSFLSAFVFLLLLCFCSHYSLLNSGTRFLDLFVGSSSTNLTLMNNKNLCSAH